VKEFLNLLGFDKVTAKSLVASFFGTQYTYFILYFYPEPQFFLKNCEEKHHYSLNIK